jgi:hypothetical protein
MNVHLFANCWNDAEMLPFFFRHYDRFVSRYIIFDDNSTDGSKELLSANSRVELRAFERTDPESFVISEQNLSDRCWKTSRGSADWVIVTDIDEHLYHQDILSLLSYYKTVGVSLVPALGYQMISEEFPNSGEFLCETRVRGAPWAEMCKVSIFDPEAIVEINFSPGRHTVEPTGRVVFPEEDKLLLLHYKYLGLERTYARHRALRLGLGTKDVANGWGHKYGWSEAEFREDWDYFARRTMTDVRLFTGQDYPLPRWWASNRTR